MSKDNGGMRQHTKILKFKKKCKPDNSKYTVPRLYQFLYLRNAWLHLKLKLSPIYFKTWGQRCLAFPPLHHNEPSACWLPRLWLVLTDRQQVSAASSLHTLPALMCLQCQITVGIVLWPTSPEHCPALGKHLLFPGVPETFWWGKNGPKVLRKTGGLPPLTLKRRSAIPFLRKQKVSKYLHLNGNSANTRSNS